MTFLEQITNLIAVELENRVRLELSEVCEEEYTIEYFSDGGEDMLIDCNGGKVTIEQFKTLDPIAFRCLCTDFVDSVAHDGDDSPIVFVGGILYNREEVEELREEIIGELDIELSELI